MTSPDGSIPAGSVGPLSSFAAKTGEDWQTEQQDSILDHFNPLGPFGDIIRGLLNGVVSAFGGNFGPLVDFIGDLISPDWLDTAGWTQGPFAFLGDIQGAIADVFSTLADLLDMVPIVGGTLSEIISNLAAGLNSTNSTAETANETASGAASQVVTLATIINVKTDNPLSRCPDPTGEPTFDWALLMGHTHTASLHGGHTHPVTGSTANATAGGTSHSHGNGSLAASIAGSHTHTIDPFTPTLTVTQGVARGGFIRLAGGQEKRTIGWAGLGTGTITKCTLTLYTEAANGDLTKFHESPNLSGDITGSYSLHLYTFDTAVVGLVPNLGDVVLAEIRIEGAGSLSVGGISYPAMAALPGFRPAKNGTTRNGGTSASPSTIADGSVGYSDEVPFLWVGADTGVNNVPRTFSDPFNRVAVGNSWALRSTTSTQLTITGDALAFNGGSDGTQAGVYVYPLTTDHQRVQIQLKENANAQPTRGILCADGTLTNWAGVEVRNSDVRIVSGSAVGTVTTRATVSTSNVAGDGFALEYTPGDNTFRVFKNSNPTAILSWVDSGNVVSHGSGKRFVGASLTRSFFVNAAAIDAWLGFDVVA